MEERFLDIKGTIEEVDATVKDYVKYKKSWHKTSRIFETLWKAQTLE